MQGIGYGEGQNQLKAVVWAHNAAGWIFCQRPQAASFLAARSAPAQEPWDELVHARGRPQIDEPGQDVDEICLRIDSGQLAVPTSSTMWVSSSILDAAHQRPGKLDGSPKRRALNHLFTWRRLVAQGTGVAGSGPLPLRDERLWRGWKFMTTKIKREPLGRPTRWGSLSSEWKI